MGVFASFWAIFANFERVCVSRETIQPPGTQR